MIPPVWQLKTPIDALVFDCDGTLSAIEGIDELAKKNGAGSGVEALTSVAMGTTGINPEMYQKRLDLVHPSQEQVFSLGMEYFTHRVPDLVQVLDIFKRLNKPIYVISAGLYPAVAIFCQLLKIPREQVFAVKLEFDSNGEFLSFDQNSPLVYRDGKRLLITQLKSLHPELAFVGDGLNDLAAADLVTRFIGFGGSYYRENIAAQCAYYIKALSMTPLLPLILTAAECEQLTETEELLYQLGLRAMNDKQVLVR